MLGTEFKIRILKEALRCNDLIYSKWDDEDTEDERYGALEDFEFLTSTLEDEVSEEDWESDPVMLYIADLQFDTERIENFCELIWRGTGKSIRGYSWPEKKGYAMLKELQRGA